MNGLYYMSMVGYSLVLFQDPNPQEEEEAFEHFFSCTCHYVIMSLNDIA